MRIGITGIAAAIIIVVGLVTIPMTIGINDGGYRTMVQYLGGTMETKFDAGIYGKQFGKKTVYNDVITFDFDRSKNAEGATIDQNGVNVQYQDGGKGSLYGILRVRLPVLHKDMLKIHNEFRSNEGIAFKLVKAYTESIINDTAGLMTSAESYAEKRGILTQWINDQLRHGKYATEQEEIITVEAGNEFCLEEKLTEEDEIACKDVRKTRKMIPVIATNDFGPNAGKPRRIESDLKKYGITVAGFEITDRSYEQKTMDQISAKRDAELAIITSKANAERAKQDTITTEQQGIANVMQAQYQEEVIKKKAIVVAERIAEVAVIAAEQKVDVATQAQLEAVQMKLVAKEYEQEQILRGQGDGAYKRLIMEADGYQLQKIEAWERATVAGYRELAKQKWSPEIMMGGSGEGGSGASNLENVMALVAVQNAKKLNLDMKMK